MYKGSKVTFILVAAGKGKRFGGEIPKQFMKLGNSTVLETALDKIIRNVYTDEVIIVTSGEYLDYVREITKDCEKVTAVIPGGAERQDSVYEGIKVSDEGLILIHDAARPFVTDPVINGVVEAAWDKGAAVPVVNLKDSIRSAEGNLDRSKLFLIQTPQGFRREVIASAYEKAMAEGFYGTDDGGIAEHAGYPVTMTEGDYENIKITTREDLPGMDLRIGSGFDVHKLIEGRKCILMGVEIPYEKGLLGHSDADVALHSLMDAMLGAAGMGDIGRLFPDNDPAYEGISSVKLLEEVRDRIYSDGFRVGNLDVTIICQKPKVSPYIGEMTDKLAEILNMDKKSINIKGTTTEKLGFTGRGEGIAAQAVCTLVR